MKQLILLNTLLIASVVVPIQAEVLSEKALQGNQQYVSQEQCQQADAQLNQVYKQLMGTLNADQKQQLKTAQRQWIKQRDAFVSQNTGNTQGALYQATMQRVIELEKNYQDSSVNKPVGIRSSEPNSKVTQLSALQKSTLETAQNDYNNACTLLQKGDFANALILYEKVNIILENILGSENEYTVDVLMRLAEVNQSLGNYTKAIQIDEKVLEVREKEFGTQSIKTAEILHNLSSKYSMIGDFEKALRFSKLAVDIFNEKLGNENVQTAMALEGLSSIYSQCGEIKSALEIQKQACKIFENKYGNNHPFTAHALENLGGCYIALGNFPKGLNLVEKAASIYERNIDSQELSLAKALMNIGTIYNTLGDYEKGLKKAEKALDIVENKLGEDHIFAAMILSNISNYYFMIKDYEKACSIDEKILKTYVKSTGSNSPLTARCYLGLASIYMANGKLNNAMEAAKKSLEINEKIYHSIDINNCDIHYNVIGNIYGLMGDYLSALSFHKKSLEMKELRTSLKDFGTVSALQNIAIDKYLLNYDILNFRETLDRAYSVKLQLLDNIMTMDESTRLSCQKNLTSDMPLFNLLEKKNQVQYILSTKGIVLDSLIEDQAAIKLVGSDSSEAQEIASARSKIGKLAFSTKKGDQVEVTRLKTRIDIILNSAANNRMNIGKVRQSATITPDSVVAALTDACVLVEFFQFSDPKFKGDAKRCYGVILLGWDGDSKFVRIDDAAGIDNSIHTLREAVAKGDEKALSNQQKLLFEKIWTPIAKALPEGTKKIFIGPDGQLNFLSFAALTFSDGSFLAEHYDIAYVGSGRDLARKVTPSDSKSITLFADPVFDRQASAFSTNALALRSGEVDAFGKIVLPPLPGTRAEEAAVEEEAKSGGWSPDPKLGEAANKSAIENLKSPGILHLATHGFYLNTIPESGADGERGMKVMEASDLSGSKTSPLPKIDPMHASGIALTGAQATLKAWSEGRVPNPNEDGILTAEEVGALNLDGTWLVTLSACETGVGEAISGEGVFGLRRAFMIAGAQNLLMTLWPVSDEVTPKIMADFYKEALATHDATGSLAKVQRDWLVKLRNEKGLLAAVRDAGPFAMVVMANPNEKDGKPVQTDAQLNSPAIKNSSRAVDAVPEGNLNLEQKTEPHPVGTPIQPVLDSIPHPRSTPIQPIYRKYDE